MILDTSNDIPRLQAALEEGRRVLEGFISALAEGAGGGGGDGLSPDFIDNHQGPLFRIARLHAEGRAAGELAAHARGGGAEAALALVYGGHYLAGLRAGLAELALHLPGREEAARALARDDELSALIRASREPDFIQRSWEVLRDAPPGQLHDLEGEHKLLRETFRTFAERRVRPLAEKIHTQDLLIPDELIREVAELGCFGLSIPLEHGGFQEHPDNLGMVVITEELSWGALIFGSLITRPEILAKALLKGGTEEQKRRFLPPMASGEKMVAISVTEPDHGSDVAGITAAARLVEGGWRLTGAKTFATFAGRAELIGLLARSEPGSALAHRGLSMFIIEKPAFYGKSFEHAPEGGGRMSGRAIATAGYRGMHSFELSFEDYFIPAENLVGGPEGRGRGFYLQMEGFAGGRLQTAGRALGVMQAAFEAARSYCRERKVFGRTLEEFQLTREKMLRMAASLQACRRSAYAAARLLDRGEGRMEASMIKFLACREAERITREAQQLHGGMGYAEEFPLARLFIDARVLSIFEGTEEVLALKVIAPALLKQVGR